MNILEAMEDRRLFGPWFKGDSWDGWRTILKAILVLEMDDADRARFRELTGRDPDLVPVNGFLEIWIPLGRLRTRGLLIARDENNEFDMLSAEGSLDQAAVGFSAGFFNDPDCLSGRATSARHSSAATTTE